MVVDVLEIYPEKNPKIIIMIQMIQDPVVFGLNYGYLEF